MCGNEFSRTGYLPVHDLPVDRTEPRIWIYVGDKPTPTLLSLSDKSLMRFSNRSLVSKAGDAIGSKAVDLPTAVPSRTSGETKTRSSRHCGILGQISNTRESAATGKGENWIIR